MCSVYDKWRADLIVPSKVKEKNNAIENLSAEAEFRIFTHSAK
jgi:hypothetical protein